jgi:uncharacterized delta-60 repeat protein
MKKNHALFLTGLLSTAFSHELAAQAGMLDPSWADDGIQILQPGTVHDRGNEVVALPSGNILVCGTTSIAGDPGAFVARLLPDGSVDTSFGTDNGYSMMNLGEETYFYDMGLDADGAIIVCGLSYITYPTPVTLLARFTPDGQLDPTFGNAGIATQQFGSDEATLNALRVLPDGRIVTAGRVGFGGTSNGLLMRHNADGTLDTSFNGQGWLTATQYPASGEEFHALGILSDGSIVAAGTADIDFIQKAILAKATSTGTWDTAFDSDGALVPDYTPEGDEIYALEAKGTQFLVGGYVYPTQDNREFFVAKFDGNGVPVSSFGTDGLVTVNNDQNEIILDLAVQSDGRILACGTTGEFGFFANRDFALLRFNADGSLDTGFGTNGITVTPIGAVFDDANGMAIQDDGKILLTGMTAGTNNDLVIARYNGEGSNGVPSINAPVSLALRPNPATDHIALGDGKALDELRLLDATGRTILRAYRTAHVEVSHLQPGTYHVVAISDGSIRQASFMKY